MERTAISCVDWRIKLSSASAMQVEAHTWNGTTRGEFIVTADVQRRIDGTRVQCVDGLVYALVGDFDYASGAGHGIPTRILDRFVDGVPEDWMQVIAGWSQAQVSATGNKTCTAEQQKNSSRRAANRQQANQVRTSSRQAARPKRAKQVSQNPLPRREGLRPRSEADKNSLNQASRDRSHNLTGGSEKAPSREITANPCDPSRVPIVVLDRLDPACIRAYCGQSHKPASVRGASIPSHADGENGVAAKNKKKAGSTMVQKKPGRQGNGTAAIRTATADAERRKKPARESHLAEAPRVQPSRRCKTRTEVAAGNGAGSPVHPSSRTVRQERHRPRRNINRQQENPAMPVAITARKGTLGRRIQVQKAKEAIAASAPVLDDMLRSPAPTKSRAIPPTLLHPDSDEEQEDAMWLAARTPRLGSPLNRSLRRLSSCSSTASITSPLNRTASETLVHGLQRTMKQGGKKSCRPSTSTPRRAAGRKGDCAKRVLKELRSLEDQLQHREEEKNRLEQSDVGLDYFSSDSSS
ncbi:unnamed protein product [Ixodes hexagonus]